MQDLPSTQPISTTPLSHEALAGLQKLFATAAEQWTEALSATLGHPVFISLDNSGLRTFRQAAYSLAPPLNLMRLRNRQDHQGWWVSLDTTAVSSMLDLMFGAPNNVWKPLERPLCSIEVELLQPVVDEFLHVAQHFFALGPVRLRPRCFEQLTHVVGGEFSFGHLTLV